MTSGSESVIGTRPAALLAKGPHVPPEAVRNAARRGLELRKKHGKGGLSTQEAGKQGIGSGVARASNLAAGDAVSTETLRRMAAFFSRHRKNKSGGEDDAGYIAWLLWGGDPGEAWAKRELAKVDRVEKGGTMLQPLIDLVEVQQFGWLELPRSYVLALGDVLAKGLSHRYIRRVPTGKVTKTGKPRYRYYYHAAHGGTVGNEDHYVVGASFKDNEGHWHITARDGDTLTLKHDETGAESTMTKRELRDHLVGLHREAVAGAQERARQDIADAKASGASVKQVARLRERAARVGVAEPETPKAEPRAEAPKAATGKLEAVGDHIWGSRKDLAQKRKIESSKDLESMSYSDAAAIVRKSKLIDPLTIAQAKERGMTPGGALAALTVMAAIREKPDDTKASRAGYVDQVRKVMGGLSRVKTARDVELLLREMRDAERGDHSSVVESFAGDLKGAKARAAQLTTELGTDVTIAYGGRHGWGDFKLVTTATPFGELGSRFSTLISKPYKNEGMERAGDLDLHLHPIVPTENGGFKVTLPNGTAWTKTPPMTAEQGWAHLQSKEIGAAEAKKAGEKKPPARSKAKDAAGAVYRVGGASVPDANPGRVREKFGFREVDYGRPGYMNQADREYHTKALEEATHDLVDILGIEPSHASFNGRVGVALGARGSGKSAAHYEPGRHAINITKYTGGGAYAHEWGHAMDDIVARHYSPDIGKAGAMGFTNNPKSERLPADLREAVGRVMDAMNNHPDPAAAKAAHAQKLSELKAELRKHEQAHTAAAQAAQALRAKPATPEALQRKVKAHEDRIDEYKRQIADLEAKKARGRQGLVAAYRTEGEISNIKSWIQSRHGKIAELRKEGLAHPDDAVRAAAFEAEAEAARSLHNDAVKAHNTLAKIDPTASTYLKRSAEEGAYWRSPPEMFARAFESFVHDELKAKGRANSYLTNAGPSVATMYPYPEGAERTNINNAMRGLMDVLKKGGHLQKAIEALPAIVKSDRTLFPLLDLLGGA